MGIYIMGITATPSVPTAANLLCHSSHTIYGGALMATNLVLAAKSNIN